MPRKSKRRETHDFDPEVMREIEKQTKIQQEIESRRRKRIWIFWSLLVVGTVVVSAAVLAFLLLI